MNPIRPISPIFMMDEDIQIELNKSYEVAKEILIQSRCISAQQISLVCKVSIDIGYLVMDKIKIEFQNYGRFINE